MNGLPKRLPRVLVTRPEPEAGATARRLAPAGFRPLVLPLSQIVPLPPVPLPLDAASVAATSAAALRFAGADFLAPLGGKPLFAVGSRTAAMGRAAGFRQVRHAAADAEALARLILAEATGPVAYLCGRVRRPDFEHSLRAGGMAVVAIETYDTQALTPAPDRLPDLSGGEPVDAVLLFSGLGAQALGTLAAQPASAALLRPAAVFALSSRILAALPAAWPGEGGRFAASEPNEDALVALLAGWRDGAGPLSPEPAPFQPFPV